MEPAERLSGCLAKAVKKITSEQVGEGRFVEVCNKQNWF